MQILFTTVRKKCLGKYSLKGRLLFFKNETNWLSKKTDEKNDRPCKKNKKELYENPT